jgi:hypothetical protein
MHRGHRPPIQPLETVWPQRGHTEFEGEVTMDENGKFPAR